MAAQAFETTLIGDSSLSKRPMRRIVDPLRAMTVLWRVTAVLMLRGIHAAPSAARQPPLALCRA